MWAGRESYLSLAEGTYTLIRPRVQPCGWRCYVRTFTVIYTSTNRTVAIDVATQVAGVRNRPVSGATCLGKVGYAPDEQLRLGIVAPHSDREL